MSFREISVDSVFQRLDSITSKRKLEDYAPVDEEFLDFSCVRMKKYESDDVNPSVGFNGEVGIIGHSSKEMDVEIRKSDAQSSTCSDLSGGEIEESVPRLHFFVRMMSGGNTLVIHANSEDSIESVHEQIQRMTKIPISEQRLIYRGKQLQWENTLAECSIENDAGLQLVGRMRSTEFPRTWEVLTDLVSSIFRLYKGGSPSLSRNVKSRVEEFLKMAPREDKDIISGHLQIFKSSDAPTALVMLYLSPIQGNRDCAEESIRLFLTPNIELLPEFIQKQCAPIVLEFCKLLSKIGREDSLYISCRNTLGSLLKTIGVIHGSRYFDHAKSSIVIREIFPFVNEFASRVSVILGSSMKSFQYEESSMSDVRYFTAFLLPLLKAIKDQVGGVEPIPVPFHVDGDKGACDGDEILSLHGIFKKLMEELNQCLKRVEEYLVEKEESESESESESHQSLFSLYLSVLKDLKCISKIYIGGDEKLFSMMRLRRISLNAFIRYVKRSDNHGWLLEHKDVTDFESKRHLVMMMFPEIKDDNEELHEMLIDRAQILEESFEYIARADAETLHGSLFMEFKNEEATGPGVVREWFCLVCQAIFNPQNALFLACPNDRRRFFPNPASKVDPLHLDYFGFCGRVIALALMHKVQVGIVFERVFFLLLAGECISLEDTKEADPCLYISCKKILEMDADFLDSDALGLTFVREIEELGSRRVVELCPGGKGIVVNSTNREEYVNLLIQHHFVTSISEQVAQFAQGFADILGVPNLQKNFFKSLELEDLDRMLHGTDGVICVKDWKAHTEYNGYQETDCQIYWFWKIVEELSAEERMILLFFWTSVKYLPVEGFCGLASRLYIFKALDSQDRLPSSQTCFYRLCLPPYPSLAVMRDRIRIITQEHISCSFGNW